MNWHELTIIPRDILFFRDAKPMEASSMGCGANWPLPNALHDSLISAMKQHWPQPQEWEFEHKHRNEQDRRDDLMNLRFGGLLTSGFFPCQDDKMFYYPCPADIDADGRQMVLDHLSSMSNLPPFLKKGATTVGKPSKKKVPAWISAKQLALYLAGESVVFEDDTEPLYDRENRTGIAINAERGATEKGNFYLAEYLRLRENVTLKGFAACESSCRGKNATDVLTKFFGENGDSTIVLGGQQGIAQVTARPLATELSAALPGGDGCGCYLKWILLTPAVFDGGWLPDWVNGESGAVMLPEEKPERQSGESRAEWRARFQTKSLNAHLIAARTEKPLVMSGWNLRKGGPRATRLAVPAGSVYWFQAETPEDAAVLCAALHGRFKSNYYGEKGYGLGICKVLETIENKGESK